MLLGSALTGVGIDRLADYICELGPSPLDRPTTVVGGTEQVPVPADATGDRCRLRVQDCRRPVRRAGLAVQGAVGHGPRRRPPRQHADRRPRSGCTGCSTCAARSTCRSTTSWPETSAPSPSWRRPRRTRRWPPRVRPCGSRRRPRHRPPYHLALEPVTQSDDDKLSDALARLCSEDPTLSVVRPEETHQTVLCGAGDTHLAVALERLARKFGVNVTTAERLVPYRETITASAEAEGKVKKQSGGHGQYAVVNLRVAPSGAGRGQRVRRQDRRRRDPAQLRPRRPEGRRRDDDDRRRIRVPGGRRQGRVLRRQVPLGRLVRHGVPHRRVARVEGGAGQGDAGGARADLAAHGHGARTAIRATCSATSTRAAAG